MTHEQVLALLDEITVAQSQCDYAQRDYEKVLAETVPQIKKLLYQ